MSDSQPPYSPPSDSSQVDAAVPAVGRSTDAWVEESIAAQGDRVGQLLAGLQEAAPTEDISTAVPQDAPFENKLAVVRLGMASSLFYALRTKHAPTAAHCLRVALSTSAWAEQMKLSEVRRDNIEVAALLHDVGKIGIPDRIIRKPGKLMVEEQLSMDLVPSLGCEILRGCTSDNELLDIVRYAGSWYESRRHDEGPSGDALPLGARMLAIADAFDSMTTDTVYRPAFSRERATEELFRGSHTQFDPELVADFAQMLEERPEIVQGCVVNRWLKNLQQDSSEFFHGSAIASPTVTQTIRTESCFFQSLMSSADDGIAFTNSEGVVTRWNDAMESLTSVVAEAIIDQEWSPEALHFTHSESNADEELDLVRCCLATGNVFSRSMVIHQPGGPSIPVHVKVTPVTGSQPGVLGTVVIVEDLSEQKVMLRKLENLHQKSTLDGLTGMANRAYFDEQLEISTKLAQLGKESFSLVICDIDHFKRVNDVYGHPAGDDAIRCFAEIMKAHSRDGDIVARYGGEEFLLLTPKCDNATTARRAELIREALERTRLEAIGGESITASFGVTEFQPGDSPETVLARADRALLKAKDNGRNRVIQLGVGSRPIEDESKENGAAILGWLSWFQSNEEPANGEFDIITPVPVDLAIEKLRGFIADHAAEIINVRENQVSIKLNVNYSRGGRRRADCQMAIHAKMTLSEKTLERESKATSTQTNIHVFLQPIRSRDRRGREMNACFDQVLNSLRSYMMGEVVRS